MQDSPSLISFVGNVVKQPEQFQYQQLRDVSRWPRPEEHRKHLSFEMSSNADLKPTLLVVLYLLAEPHPYSALT